MKVFWMDGALHFKPEDKQEDEALTLLAGKLNIVNFAHEIGDGTVRHINSNHHNPVVAMNEFPKVIADNH
jgi:hypothetical protein